MALQSSCLSTKSCNELAMAERGRVDGVNKELEKDRIKWVNFHNLEFLAMCFTLRKINIVNLV